MPRGPGLDSPGTLHHVIIRGIEKREIVADDKDRGIFVSGMGSVVVEVWGKWLIGFFCLCRLNSVLY